LLYFVSAIFGRGFILVEGNKITIGVLSKPIGGAANKEIIKKMAKHFGVSSANVVIKSGHKSKEKVVEII